MLRWRIEGITQRHMGGDRGMTVLTGDTAPDCATASNTGTRLSDVPSAFCSAIAIAIAIAPDSADSSSRPVRGPACPTPWLCRWLWRNPYSSPSAAPLPRRPFLPALLVPSPFCRAPHSASLPLVSSSAFLSRWLLFLLCRFGAWTFRAGYSIFVASRTLSVDAAIWNVGSGIVGSLRFLFLGFSF